MIAPWMLFAIIAGGVFTAAGIAAERFAAARRFPRRFIWLAVLLASACWPIAAATLVREAPPDAGLAGGPSLVQQAFGMSSLLAAAPAGEVARQLDWAIVAVWCVMSGLLIVRLLFSVARVQRARRRWQSATVDDMQVRIAPNEGPALLAFPMEILLPEWVLGLERALRAIVLDHEAQHRSARDPYLLYLATILTVLAPWNIPLWLQARRLRLAVEIDCDARVLSAHPDRGLYGLLLVAIGQRRSIGSHWLAPALLEPPSTLEQRISAMNKAAQPVTRLRMILPGLATAAALVVAFSIRPPETGLAFTQFSAHSSDSASAVFFEYQVDKPAGAVPGTVNPIYPAEKRAAGVEGDVRVQFVVDTGGYVEPGTVKVVHSTDEAFSAAVLSSTPRMRFSPAELRGRKVRQLVDLPVSFRIAR